jgi:hypothetical protein
MKKIKEIIEFVIITAGYAFGFYILYIGFRMIYYMFS